MPKTVDIQIFMIANTAINHEEVRRWLKCIEAIAYDPQFDKKTDSELLVELAGRRCYKSFQPGLNPNVTKIRTDLAEYIENILKSKHGSVLEHASYTFAIENISRVFTAEMNRHRAGWAISEGSMRYIRFDEIPYWVPLSIRGLEPPFKVDSTDPNKAGIEYKKYRTRQIFREAFKDAEEHYKELQRLWEMELAPESKFHQKKEITSMMRRIIPMGVATGGLWTGNIRAIRHVLTMRCSPAAEEEILYVFSTIMKDIAKAEPTLFGDFYQTEDGYWTPKYIKV